MLSLLAGTVVSYVLGTPLALVIVLAILTAIAGFVRAIWPKLERRVVGRLMNAIEADILSLVTDDHQNEIRVTLGIRCRERTMLRLVSLSDCTIKLNHETVLSREIHIHGEYVIAACTRSDVRCTSGKLVPVHWTAIRDNPKAYWDVSFTALFESRWGRFSFRASELPITTDVESYHATT